MKFTALGATRLLNITGHIIEGSLPDGRHVAQQVRASAERQMATINTAILGEYFAKADVAKGLFTTAKELEAAAFQRGPVSMTRLSIEARSMMACLLDFWGLERVKLLVDPVANADSA